VLSFVCLFKKKGDGNCEAIFIKYLMAGLTKVFHTTVFPATVQQQQ
jgi:hypothetical protein